MSTSAWQELPSPATRFTTNLVSINPYEFICVAFPYRTKQNSVLKFNTINNEWIELKLPKELRFRSSAICVHSNDSNVLYIAAREMNDGLDRAIVKLNLANNEYQIVGVPDDFGMCELLPVNDDIHMIGGKGGCHAILKSNQSELEKLGCYSKGEEFSCHSSVYISKKNMIYTFGGYHFGGECIAVDTIQSYNLETKEHNQLDDLRIPKWGRDSFGCIMTNDEKYVIIFGGEDDDEVETDDIYVFDMDGMNVRTSNIKCPKDDEYYAVLMGNHQEHLKIVYGYIRWCWSLEQFDGISFPCHDVIDLMVKWYSDEIVYLFARQSSNSVCLWMMSLFEILQ